MSSLREALPGWIRDTVVGRQIAEEGRRHDHAGRQVGLDRLVELRKARPPLIAKHDKAIAPLVEAATLAKAKAEAAAVKVLDAQRARGRDVGQLDHEIEMLERQLRQSADARIREAMHALGIEYDKRRGTLARHEDVPTGQRDGNTMRLITNHLTNQVAIQQLLGAIRHARSAFDRLELENPADVEAAIAAVQAPVVAAWARIEELDPMPQRAA